MGFGYMFEFWVVVDAIVELGGWCDLCENMSIGCKILRELFMSTMG